MKVGHQGRVFTLIRIGTATVFAISVIPNAATRAESRAVRDLQIERSPVTTRATFITAKDGGPIWTPTTLKDRENAPAAFLNEMGHLFGVTDVDRELSLDRLSVDRLGNTHSSFQQHHRGVPVFGAVLRVHQDRAGAVSSANGDFFPQKPDLVTIPTLTAGLAIDAAADAVDCGAYLVDRAELVIVDPGWYGDPPIGDHLAYYIILQGTDAITREAFFVDAHTGRILDQWDLTERALFRRVYLNGPIPAAPLGVDPRIEGDPETTNVEQNRAYDWAGDVYRFFFNAFGYDSIDGEGTEMLFTVDYWRLDAFCPNAFWDGRRSAFCTGTVTDDVLGHEVGHGIVDYSANLVYQNQSGQLNESFADIWGEMTDLYNGNAAFFGPPDGEVISWPEHPTGPGTDEPNSKRVACSGQDSSVRWLISEDAVTFNGAIRDMWKPTCMGDPDKASHPFQSCNPNDNGGVHSGSGIPNHAFAMLCDGKNADGFFVQQIGAVKASAVWFRALTVYLTPLSDFLDAYWAINQAAADLVGTFPNDPRTGDPWPVAFTDTDRTRIDAALRAVEMNTEGRCGATVDVLTPIQPDRCVPRALLHTSLFENGPGDWTVSNNAATPYDWELVDDLPFGRTGTAFFCNDLDSNCFDGNESGTHTLTSPVIQMSPRFYRPVLEFTHYMASEPGWDGGILRISVNGGPFEYIPPGAILHNRYNTTLITSGNGNTNPLAGQAAWTGSGGQWGVTHVGLDLLVEPGDSFQVQFVFGKDRCNGVDGWWIDNVLVYTCVCASEADCIDEVFCNGEEICVEGFCESGQPPCPGRFCDEETDTCDLTIFHETFENGNDNGWTMSGPDDTATEGDWRIGRPNGTSNDNDQAQPEGAFEGGACAFTELNTTLGGGDVDGGAVYLISPSIDLTDAPIAELSYVRWFYNRDGLSDDDPDDWFAVEVSDDDGTSWIPIEFITNGDPPANAWTPQTVGLDGVVTMDDGFRIRVGASDGALKSNVIESAMDNIRIVAISECQTDLDCDDGDECTLDTCMALKCENQPFSCATMTLTVPASGSVDARQPHAINSSAQRQGWHEILMLYEGPRSPVAGDFTVMEVGGDGNVPLHIVSPVAPNVISLNLAEPIEAGAWTMITHNETGWKTCLGSLPGDTNGDRLTSAADVNALIDAINGVFPLALPTSSKDMDHSTEVNGQDVLRLIDLLNGASEFDVWLARSLPPNPCD